MSKSESVNFDAIEYTSANSVGVSPTTLQTLLHQPIFGDLAMSSVAIFIAFVFWTWMIFDCVFDESEQVFWGLILILFNLSGAAAYFVIRWLPRSSPLLSRLINRRKKQRELQRAITDIRAIGSPCRFIQLGRIYQDLNDRGHALAAYYCALNKAPNRVEALWGVATLEIKNNNLQRAANCLQKLMSFQPDYHFGEASLAYCQTLYKLGDFNSAEHQLNSHIRRWSHLEAFLLIAQIKVHQQNAPGAHEVLTTRKRPTPSTSAHPLRIVERDRISEK